MFGAGPDGGTTETRLKMSDEPDDRDAHGAHDPEPVDTDVDEASEDSFPASDPPSYGSAEPG